MLNIDDRMFGRTITQMPANFDSHAFIDKLKSNHPHEYAMDLAAAQARAHHPERALHARYAKRLRHFAEVTARGRVYSPNVLGRRSACESWERC
jgi:hypothetical protein